jgi:hypothetical protein
MLVESATFDWFTTTSLLILRHFAEPTASNLLLTSFLFSGLPIGEPVALFFCVRLEEGRTTMCIIVEPQTVVHFHLPTTLTSERFIAGLTDFGPDRSRLFANSTDEYFKMHYLGHSEADVTEGSHGIWERLYYDWSDRNHVILTTTDSNVWECGSSYTYTLSRQADGTTDIDVRIAREGKNFKGWVLGLLMRTFGKVVLKRQFENSVKAIEARNGREIDREIRSSLRTIEIGEIHTSF